MVLDLLQSLEILSELGVDLVRNELAPGSFLGVVLSVQEPFWDIIFGWSSEDVINLLNFSFSDLSGSLVEIDLSLLEDDVGESSTNTFDGGKSEHDFLGSLNIGILDSENMSELVFFNELDL